MELSIAKEYSAYPAGRYTTDGPFNATRFRNDYLVPAIEKAYAKGAHLVVLLDGVGAYSSSFLEEAFGGLVRKTDLPLEAISSTLRIEARDPAYFSAKLDAEQYLSEALDRGR